MDKMDKDYEIWEDAWINTLCGMCYANCAIRVHRVNGVPVKIEGDPDSSFGGRGGICGKGAAGLMFLHDPNRLNVPLRRTNPEKGIGIDPGWEEISWEEALDEIARRWQSINGSDPSRLWVGFTTIHAGGWALVIIPFIASLGSSSFVGGGGLHCGDGAHFVAGLAHGAWSIAPDWKYTNYVLQWGASKGTASGHSMTTMARLRGEATARGAKVVVFDPMCHFAGGKATEWVPILPGTDGVVAIAMANIIVNELGIYDEEYLKTKTNLCYLVRPDGRYIRDKETNKPLVWDSKNDEARVYDDSTVGDYALEGIYQVYGVECQPAFVALKEDLKKWTPERASEVSTVPAGTIRRIANEFAENARVGSTITIDGITFPYRPVASILFRGAEGHTNSMHTCSAIDLLNELVGACDVPGGCLGWPAMKRAHPDTGHWNMGAFKGIDGILTPGLFYRHAPWPLSLPKIPVSEAGCREFLPCMTSTPFFFSTDGEEVGRKLGYDRKPEMLINFGCNFLVSLANWDIVLQKLKQFPFIVQLDIYSNEIAEGVADILLPAQSYLERFDWMMGMSYFFNHPPTYEEWCFHVQNPVIDKPIAQRRNDMDVLFELADRVGLRGKLNETINTVFKIDEANKIKPDEKLSWTEMGDKVLKWLYGPERGVEHFRKYGYISYPKDIKEIYWRPFTDARVPVYKEYLLDIGDKAREIGEKVGLELDWEQYTPHMEWFPAIVHKEHNDEYDLYCFSYRDIMHTGTQTGEIPWIDEVSQLNPYTYTITMNADTAKSKGLKDGDIVWLESPYGRKVKGPLKLMQGHHPQTVAIAACSGLWAKGRPIARDKGTNFDILMELDRKHCAPVTMNLETCVPVKLYKARGS